MKIDKSWTKIRRRSWSAEFWNGLQKFLNMAKPFPNDKGFIRCPSKRCINNDSQQMDTIENHIFRFSFMKGYEVWTLHGENENDNVTANVPEQMKGYLTGMKCLMFLMI